MKAEAAPTTDRGFGVRCESYINLKGPNNNWLRSVFDILKVRVVRLTESPTNNQDFRLSEVVGLFSVWTFSMLSDRQCSYP